MATPRDLQFVLRLPERLAVRLRTAMRERGSAQQRASGVGGGSDSGLGDVLQIKVVTESGAAEGVRASLPTAPASRRETEAPGVVDTGVADTRPENFSLLFFPENRSGRLAALRIGNEHRYEEYFGYLFDLPCTLESYKTLDGRTVYKSADVHQLLQIYEDPKDLPLGNNELLPDGLTPASRGFVERHQPEPGKFCALEVAQYEEIIKYVLDFRKSWKGTKPVRVDADDEVVEEEEVWVPADEGEAVTVDQEERPDTAAWPASTGPLHMTITSPDVEGDKFAMQLEQELMGGPDEADAAEAEAEPPTALHQAERARIEMRARELESRVRDYEQQLHRATNPVLRGRIHRRLEEARTELQQQRSAQQRS
ncbi:hypothetical protein CDCA_CDCA02G0690 [Cyanidium caldarium]|uniref:TAFII55 protein conserved region domain-containing protein n=1 Tax=Cyanidium caldarium TaxID=2771 RepID=A0AAV9IQT3_CYACA|nr:hypothetical protein CDCA_CDCA02G0690 [Cyanidium caldarium]